MVMLGEATSPTGTSFDSFGEIIPWPGDNSEVVMFVEDCYKVVIGHGVTMYSM